MNNNTKKNLWPIGLIVVLGIFALWLAIFIIFATNQRSNLVTPSYYAEELKYQEQIDRINRSNLLKKNVAIKFYTPANKIVIVYPDDLDYKEIDGEIELFRPSDNRLDQEFPVQPDSLYEQVISTGNLQSGLWKVHVLWRYNGLEYYSEDVIVKP